MAYKNPNFSYLFLALILIFGGLFVFDAVSAQVNQSLEFVGKVTQINGTELSDGVYDFDFALYDQPSGGVALWSESRNATTSFSATIASSSVGLNTVTYTYSGATATGTLRVGQYLSDDSGNAALIYDFDHSAGTVTVVGNSAWANGLAINNRPYVEGGVIEVDLGAVNDFSGVDFDQTLYLEIGFNGETMRPRKIISPVAQAFNADTLDGFHAGDFANLSADATVTGEWTFSNILSVSTTSDQTALTISQNGSGDIVDFRVGSTTAFAVLNDGRVQIGDYFFPTAHGAPGYVLKTDAAGDLYWDVDFAGSGGGSGLWASSTNNDFIFQADTGQLVVLGNNATTSPYVAQLEVQGFSWFDNVGISNQQALRLYDLDSSNYAAIRAASNIGADFVLTLPADAGSSGETLITDGSGNLTWGTPTGNGTVGSGLAGQFPYYASDGTVLAATSSVFISPLGRVGIGTTTPNTLLSVAGSGQFYELCIGASCISDWGSAGPLDGTGVGGQITYWVDGNTLGATSTVDVTVGGTGKSSWTPNSIPFLSDANTFSEILIGTSTYLLSVNASGDGYEWVSASSTGVDTLRTDEEIQDVAGAMIGTTSLITILYSDAEGLMSFEVENDLTNFSWANVGTSELTAARGGTGWDSSAVTGFPYINAGTWSATSTIAAVNIESLVMLEGENISLLNNDANFIDLTALSAPALGIDYNNLNGQLTLTSGYIIPLVSSTTDWQNTYTLVNANNGNWTSAFDQVTASSTEWGQAYAWGDHSAQNYFDLDNGPLPVADGGTGTSTFEANSLVYASARNVIGEILSTSPGEILQLNASGIPTWVSTSSLGIDFNGVGGMLTADQGGTGQDSSTWTGFTFVEGGVWSASSTISSSRLQDLVMLEGENISLLNNDAGFITDGNTGWDNSYGFITLTDLSAPGTGIDYNNTNGQFTITSGYVIPLVASTTDWQTAYTLVNANNANWTSTYNQLVASSSEWGEAYDNRITSVTGNLELSSNQLGVVSGYVIPRVASTTNWNDAYNELTASSTYWNEGYLYRITSVASPLNLVNNSITIDGNYNIPLTASTTNWNWAYELVNASSSEWGSGASLDELSLDQGYIYVGSASNNPEATSTLFLAANGNIGFGTTSPLSRASIYGNLFLEGSDSYINFGATTSVGVSGYGFRDNSGTIEYRNAGGNWSDLSSVGMSLDDLSAPAEGLDYNNVNGQITLSTGYIIPLVASTSDWQSSYTLVNASNNNWTSAYDQVTASSTEWGLAYENRITSANDNLEITNNQLGVASGYNIPLTASTTEWDEAYIYRVVAANGPLTLSGNTLGIDGNYNIPLTASTTNWNSAYDIVAANSGDWNTAFSWGDHSTQNYFDTDNGALSILFGGTGSSTAAGARENLDLDELYDFGINSTATSGYIWMSDGDGRGRWVASTTLMSEQVGGDGSNQAKFVGTTTALFDGSFATSTLVGYQAANNICSSEFSGAFFCRVYDILVTVEQDDISSWGGSSWVAEGPPGYTSNSNDCQGWTSNHPGQMGAFWAYDSVGGGMGWLTNCSVSKPIACCSR